MVSILKWRIGASIGQHESTLLCPQLVWSSLQRISLAAQSVSFRPWCEALESPSTLIPPPNHQQLRRPMQHIRPSLPLALCPMKDERHICVGRICSGEDQFAVLTLHLPQLGSNSLVSSKPWLREGIEVKGGWLHADGCLVALKETFLTSVGVNNWRC